jgi:hypothetical protein
MGQYEEDMANSKDVRTKATITIQACKERRLCGGGGGGGGGGVGMREQ